MLERVKELGSWAKRHKRDIAVAGLAAVAAGYGLTEAFTKSGDAGNTPPKHPLFQEGLSLRVGSARRSLLLSYTVGEEPIPCPDGRQVNTSFNTYGLRLSLDYGAEAINTSPVRVAPSLACRTP